ncbi:MAG: hypothetical protein WBX11_12075 [Thiobacillaceae bacterium]
MMHWLVLLGGSWLTVWLFLLLAYVRPLWACWKEPVLKCPVLILESDDWGAGPLEQAEALDRIVHYLSGFRDQTGHPAVMTLGIILEVPDGERIRQDDLRAYHGLRINSPVFAPVRSALDAGIEARVLAPQLHGLTHYRPSTLLKLAGNNAQVREWLTGSSPATTETLPDALQSNWIDAASLPSLPLSDAEIEHEARDACAAYREVFGPPRVAVATTFIWSEQVEQAWKEQGVDTVVTPGRRYTSRNILGQPDGVDKQIYNGMISSRDLLYLVRDVYFEPARGNGPEKIIDGAIAKTALGQPTLVETHRFNFLGPSADTNLGALCDALARIMARWPQIRFLSSAELADVYRDLDPNWIESRVAIRVRTWVKRVQGLPRFRKLSQMTGLILVLKLIGSSA